MAWGLEAIPRRTQGAAWREVDDEIYICSEDGEVLYTLSPVAADIWRACDGRNTVRDITELLLAAYDVESGRLSADLADCLADLEGKGLLGQG